MTLNTRERLKTAMDRLHIRHTEMYIMPALNYDKDYYYNIIIFMTTSNGDQYHFCIERYFY